MISWRDRKSGNQELWNSFAPDELNKAIGEQDSYNKTYYETGELLGAYRLSDAA